MEREKVKITFDSNSWQQVVRPDIYAKDPRNAEFVAINGAVKSGKLDSYIVETVATLEAIKKADRADFLASARLDVKMISSTASDAQARASFQFGPDNSSRAPLAPILFDRLREAKALGFHLLKVPRFGLPIPQELTEDFYHVDQNTVSANNRNEELGGLLRLIEARGVGRAAIVNIGNNIRNREALGPGPWFEVLDKAENSNEEKAIQKAVAEWADGDSIAAHIAYGHDIFCTEDQGKSAGVSVLDSPNRKWLEDQYRVRFMTISELGKIV